VLLGGNAPAAVATSNLHVGIPVGTATRGILDLRDGQEMIV